VNVLVTGGAGFIGSHTTRVLLQREHSVTVYDNLSEGHAAAVPADCTLVKGDLANHIVLEDAMRQFEIDAVVHFAASCLVGESMSDPRKYYRNNVSNTTRLADAMLLCGVNRIVFSSTAAVYGNPVQERIEESHPLSPINPYGATKLHCERLLADYSAAYGLGCVSLRYFNAAGAAADGTIGEDHDPETHLIPLAIRSALKQEELSVFGDDYDTPDGTCVRDYIHVDDLAEAHALALEAIDEGTAIACNLGNGRGASVREVVDVVADVSEMPVPVQMAPRRPGDPAVLVASADKARADLGWKPQHESLRDIVSSAWEWHRAHPDGYGG